TSLYPAASARSRAGIASATHGRRPAFQSRITAASIIRRSASGSATLPNCDSPLQRRASQPSTWSVIAATPKTLAAAQLWPPSEASSSAMKTGIIASRAIVRALGIDRMLKGYGGGGDPQPAGVRQRAQPRLPARLARPHGGRGLLGLARVHAGRGPGTVPRTGPHGLRARVPGDARRRLHGRRGVPLPGPARGARRGRGCRRGRDRDRPAPLRVRARRARAVPAGVAGRIPGAARGGPDDRRPRRPCPPLRARLPARVARGARALLELRRPSAARARRRAAT